MVRKVIAGNDLLRAAGTASKHLAAWLAKQGYVESADAKEATQVAGEAARDLPAANDLTQLLYDFAQTNEQASEEDDAIEGYFVLTRVEEGKVWLEGMLDGKEIGPITVPQDISSRCKPGWSIAGMLGRFGKSWRFIEAWNVYPG